MNTLNRTDLIKDRLQQALAPSYLAVVDESDEHIGHANYQGGGKHFAIVIAAQKLDQLTRVEAHRAIYALLADMVPDQIHAVRIQILRGAWSTCAMSCSAVRTNKPPPPR